MTEHYTPDVTICPQCGKDIDGNIEVTERRKMAQEIAFKFLILFEGSMNPRATSRAVPFAFGLRSTGGKSEAETAAEIGMTKEAFNKEIRRLQRIYHERNNRNNKSEQAQQKYKEIGKHDHWRKHTSQRAARIAIRNATESVAH